MVHVAFGFLPFGTPFWGPFFPFVGLSPLLTLPIGILAGAFDRPLFPGFAAFPPGGFV